MRDGNSLLGSLARITDPRKRRGRRHALGAVLAVAVAAVLAGAKSLAQPQPGQIAPWPFFSLPLTAARQPRPASTLWGGRAVAVPAGRLAGPGGGGGHLRCCRGKAGVGKSALAVNVAHQLAAEFPDGQLYASLRGAGGGGTTPLEPAEILGRFLRALGVDGGAIPSGVEERVALYRSRLAGRRVLVVLDDAASEAQVRPLLPGTPTCAVLITSRARLAGLEGARVVDLDVLDAGQAAELLARIAGPERVAAEPDAVAAIVAACGGLPLAVRIAGARLAARPHWPLAQLAERPGDERGRLDELAYGDLEVRASLSLSYQGW